MSRRWERRLLVAAIAAGIALRLAYVIATHGHRLAGDEYEYDLEGRFLAAGHFLWSTTPYGVAHATMWKAPGYPLFVGLLYDVLGSGKYDRVLVFQAIVLTPFVVGLTWLLGRRLFGAGVAVAAAWVAALYPNVWQFHVRLYSEAIADPLSLLVLVSSVGVAFGLAKRAITPRRAALVGLALGLTLLVRPSSILLLPAVAVAWWAAAGARRGTLLVCITAAVTIVTVVPWTLRNRSVDPSHLVPISMQSASGYGTFNDDAAHDARFPWAWRALPSQDLDLLGPHAPHRSDASLYAALVRRERRYISKHPASVLHAFYWNGLRRLWDLRAPSQALFEVPFEGRTRAVTATGLYMYWGLLALTLAGLVALWRRGRRGLVLALLAMALAGSVVYTSDAGTRYRTVYEPLIGIVACSVLVPVSERTLARRRAATEPADVVAA